MLSEAQRRRLLEIARNAIAVYLSTGAMPEISETDEVLTSKKGAFVTITEGGALKGCIGHIVADMPLYTIIRNMAVEAAIGDPRFTPLSKDELNKIELEISVLSDLVKIDDIDKIEPGRHGLLIRKGFNSGLLLPQVATDYGWSRTEFLQNTCSKAGLDMDAWKRGADIYIFSAEVFGERDIR